MPSQPTDKGKKGTGAAAPAGPRTGSPRRPLLSDREILAISRAISDPRRFEVLRRIAGGGARCSDLRACLPISAATLSHHIKELESAGLIAIVREGKFMSAALRREVWKAYLAGLKTLAS